MGYGLLCFYADFQLSTFNFQFSTFIFPLLLVFFLLSYVVLVIWMHAGWHKLARFEATDSPVPGTSVTVIVPARNEELRIRFLLDGLSAQDYPPGLLQILVVDDHSTDRTAEMAAAYAGKHADFTVLSLPEGEQGKKAALRYALSHVKGTLVVTTDADCRVPTGWIRTIARFYEKYSPAMIIGPVLFTSGPIFSAKWQALEMFSLTGSSAGTAAWDSPVMCSGANLAVKKDVLLRHAHVYDSAVASGDDMMMMMDIKKGTDRIMYLKSTTATVETMPQPGLKSFIRQRTRWTSKSPGYTDKTVILVAMVVFLAALSMVISLFAGFFRPVYFGWAAFLWLLKSMADFPFLYSLTGFWNRKKLMRIFIPAQIIYPFYVVFVAMAGVLLPVRWKGRGRPSG